MTTSQMLEYRLMKQYGLQSLIADDVSTAQTQRLPIEQRRSALSEAYFFVGCIEFMENTQLTIMRQILDYHKRMIYNSRGKT